MPACQLRSGTLGLQMRVVNENVCDAYDFLVLCPCMLLTLWDHYATLMAVLAECLPMRVSMAMDCSLTIYVPFSFRDPGDGSRPRPVPSCLAQLS